MSDEAARIAAERKAALKAAAGSGAAMPWEAPDTDLEAAAAAAKEMERDHVSEFDSDQGGWRTRAEEGLIAVDENGVPLATVSRSVDLRSAEEYGEMSKQAIATINKYFAHQGCSEIHLNAPDQVFAKYQGERVQIDCCFSSEEEYNRFIEDLVRQADTTKTWQDIKAAARGVVRMQGGDRMMIFTPPLTQTVHVAIHKVVARQWNLQTLIDNGTMNSNMANLLVAAVKSHANILVVGEMGAGKSVLLSLLAQYIGANERVALIEEVPEIFVDLPDVTPITYYPQTPGSEQMGLPEVLDTALYGRFDRILIGEIHDRGMYRMLRVMATGGDGSMSTFHAGEAKSALEQVRNHVLLEYPQLPPSTVAHFVRSAVNLVVVVERIDAIHRIKQIAEVEWRNLSNETDIIGLNELFAWDERGERSVDGQPGFVSISRPDDNGKLVEKVRRYGVKLSPEWFPSDNIMVR